MRVNNIYFNQSRYKYDPDIVGYEDTVVRGVCDLRVLWDLFISWIYAYKVGSISYWVDWYDFEG